MRSIVLIAFAVVGALAASATAQVRYSNPQPLPNYYPDRAGPGYGNQAVSCGSPQYKLARCQTPAYWRGAQLVRQTSKSACVQGQTWGFDRGGLWVNKGCGGVFAPGNFNGGAPGGWQPGPGWNRPIALQCGSPQYKYFFCQVDVGPRGQVMLQRQISDTRCIEGRNWGWNRAGIWVDKGCGAQFVVDRRW